MYFDADARVFVLSNWHKIQLLWQIFCSNLICLDVSMLHVTSQCYLGLIDCTNMFPWQLLLRKWVKDIFSVIILMVAKKKSCFTGQFHAILSRSCHPYLMDFLEIFTSGSYHRDMKILKIFASNSKQFRVYGILKNLQIEDDGARGGGWPANTKV